MPVVAVINRKGGSGKSTLATQLAGYFAQCGRPVMLGDVDRQQSSLAWLRRRATHPLGRRTEILGWAVDPRNARRTPPGVTHVVLDTPGGLHGLELARAVMHADVVLVPVSPSAFDRESAAEVLAELMRQPRVSSGRCRVAVVGMRMDARSRSVAQLQQWALRQQVPCLGALRDSRVYPRTAEEGLSLFDLPTAHVRTDLAQWQPLLDWVDRQLARPAELREGSGLTTPGELLDPPPRLSVLKPATQPGFQPRPAPSAVSGGLDARPVQLAPLATPATRVSLPAATPLERPAVRPVPTSALPVWPGAATPPLPASGGLRQGLGRLFTALRSAA